MVGQKPCGAWNWKYATAISPARMKATGRVNSPSRSRPPPTTSSRPPIPACDSHGTVPPSGGTPAGKAKSFIVPDGMKMNAAAMRSTLWSCGPQLAHFATMAGVVIMGSARLSLALLGHLRALALLLRPQLGRELGAEVLRLEHLANLDLRLGAGGGVGRALEPLDGLGERLHLDQPEAGDELLGLGEGPVDHRALVAGEPDARALRARVESLAREHHPGLDQLFVVVSHLGEELLVRKDPCLRVLVRLDQHHESHRPVPPFSFGSEPSCRLSG